MKITSKQVRHDAEIFSFPSRWEVGDSVCHHSRGSGVVRKVFFWATRKNHNFRFQWRARVDLDDGGTCTIKHEAALATAPTGLVHAGGGVYQPEEVVS